MSYPKPLFQNLPQNLSREEICNPTTVIKEFFNYSSLPDARHALDKWVRSAFAKRSQLGKKESLALLDLKDHLIRLLEAACLLNDDGGNGEKGLLLSSNDAILMNTALYYTHCKDLLAWDCFPRHLTLAEYANPYIVFEICLGQLELDGWRRFLKDLFFAATYDMQISEAVNDADLYHTCQCLFKLLVACHLIKVRDIDGGTPAMAMGWAAGGIA